jgi:hypothetical protein
MTLLQEGDRRTAEERLKALFSKANGETKSRAAYYFVRLEGNEAVDQPYFDYLAQGAIQALATDMPCQFLIDERGEVVASEETRRRATGELDPRFERWAVEHGMTAKEALTDLFRRLNEVNWLARTGDARGFDLFVRGLAANNCMLATASVQGLGKIGDRRAAAHLLQAVDRLPAGSKQAIAEALLRFRDPESEAAARSLVNDKALFEVMKEHAIQEIERREVDPEEPIMGRPSVP